MRTIPTFFLQLIQVSSLFFFQINYLSSASFSISLIVLAVNSSDDLFYRFMCIVWSIGFKKKKVKKKWASQKKVSWVSSKIDSSAESVKRQKTSLMAKSIQKRLTIHLETVRKGQPKGASEFQAYHSIRKNQEHHPSQ